MNICQVFNMSLKDVREMDYEDRMECVAYLRGRTEAEESNK